MDINTLVVHQCIHIFHSKCLKSFQSYIMYNNTIRLKYIEECAHDYSRMVMIPAHTREEASTHSSYNLGHEWICHDGCPSCKSNGTCSTSACNEYIVVDLQ